MGVEQALASLRAEADTCSLVAFGDLRTKLVLRVSADSNWPRERLDQLCVEASECFQQADSAVLRDAGLSDSATPARETMILDAREVRIFVRSDDDPNDVICCVCRSAEDAPILARAAHAALRAI